MVPLLIPAATKDYVDTAISTGLVAKTPALVVSTTNVTLSGLQTIDSVTLVANDRVLLVGQTNPIENGLWLAQAGAWTRPTDFAAGSTVGQAYVLVTSGTVNAGSSWLSNTPTAIVGTDPISFVLFSLPAQTTGANVGTGAGQIFRDKTGVTLNFKTIAAGSHITVTNNANEVVIGTDATSANTADTIVARDASGNFSAGTITAALTGAASLNVLKSGDTMTGNLNLANQSELRLQDAAGGEYVGLRAPTTISASYTIDYPTAAPTAGQFLQAISPTALQWATAGGSPTDAKTYYVSLNGSDSNDGSFSAPFRTVAHAITVANGVASSANPVAIRIGSGVFIEDNTGGALSITADNITIIGTSATSTSLIPMSLANDFFSITVGTVEFSSFSIVNAAPGSTAHAILLNGATFGTARFEKLNIGLFETAVASSNAIASSTVIFEDIACGGNGTNISIIDMQGVIKNSLFQGPLTSGAADNIGLVITGTQTQVAILSNAFKSFETAIDINGGANVRILGCDIESTITGVITREGSDVALIGCNFYLNESASINVIATDAQTHVTMEGCHYQCNDINNVQQGTAIKVINGATTAIDSCAIENAGIGIECGDTDDTATTQIQASGAILENCTTDIIQRGSSTLNFFGGVVNADKLVINDPTNVSFAAFNEDAELIIGTGADVAHTVYEILNGEVNPPGLVYQPNYYGHQGTVYTNVHTEPTFNATQAQSNDASYYVVTGDRTKEAGLHLISDTADFGVGNNIRGWHITKAGTSADLVFTYTNNDTSGQAARAPNPLMRLNGFDNQLEFPLATISPLPTNLTTKLLWGSDTTLYRSAANTLKTDGNMVIAGLNTDGVVHTDVSGNLTSSLIVNADVDPAAAIVDTKLATISTPGKVANSATTATSANTANAIVARDASGNFSAGTITAALVGAASLNVLKSGDTMTGNLNLANQSELRLQDATGGEYVGLRAPTAVTSSYTIDLPDTAPTTGQVLQATSSSATTWAGIGGSPTVNKTYYVSLSGSDSNDGSLSAPFRTISHAVTVANGVASSVNPVVISIGAGIFVEDNSGGPITVTANGISLVGESITGTMIIPSTLSNDLFRITAANIEVSTLTLNSNSSSSTANAVTVITSAPGNIGFNDIVIYRFQTGFALSGTDTSNIVLFEDLLSIGNGTVVSGNNVRLIVKNSLFLGPFGGTTPENTAISVTGTNALITLMHNSYRLMNTAIAATGGADMRILSNNIESTINGIAISGAAKTEALGCNFIYNYPSSICISATGANTILHLDACHLLCTDTAGNNQGTGIKVTSGAEAEVIANAVENAVIGIHCGDPGDTSTTGVTANATAVRCTTDIMQQGASTLHFVGGTFSSDAITIVDPTNVTFAAFDASMDSALTIGDNADNDQLLYQVLTGQSALPNLGYRSNYYGNKGTVYLNENSNPTFNAIQATSSDANYFVITNDRTKQTGINLLSDTSNVGNGDNIRGWTIAKVANSAELMFTYTNNDTSGQAARGSNIIMQLNGFDNQVEFPTAVNTPLPTNTNAKLVWAGDTNLYRAAVGLLKTDGNIAIGGLTADRVVVTDGTSQLTSSATTASELGNLAGVTGPIQTQIDSKVSKTGDTMTGALRLPAGTTASPSLNFTGSTLTGLSANTSNLSLSTAGAERLRISSTGTVSINQFTTAGVVHNDVSGNLSSSLIVNADVDPAAAIVDTKLATISTAGKVANSATTATSANTANAIVARDASGNFSAGTITAALTGAASLNVLRAGDTMTGALTVPAGTTAVPSLRFTGSTNTGISAASANVLSLSTLGTEGLRIDASANTTYKSNYKLHAYRSTNQGINNTTATIVFNTESLDPNANYNTATGVYTAPFTGTYLIAVTVTTQTSNQPSTETINIIRNGVAVVGASAAQTLRDNNSPQPMTTVALVSLTAGDLVRIDYTTNKNDTIQADDTHLSIHFMSF